MEYGYRYRKKIGQMSRRVDRKIMHTEKQIEQYLVKRSREAGFMCVKWTGETGVPDRILIARGSVTFVEVKSPIGKLSAIQKLMHLKLQDQGATVVTVYGYDSVDWLINELLTE